MTIRGRLLLLLIVAITPLIAVDIHSEIEGRKTRQREIGQEASRLLTLTAAEQSRIDDSARQLLTAISELPSVRQGDWPACSDVLSRIFKRVEGYANIGVADLDGHVMCSVFAPPPNTTYRDSSIYIPVDTHTEFAIGIYQVGRVVGKKILPISLAWHDDQGNIHGVLWATIDLDWLAQHFADRFFSKDVTLLIADAHGTILVRLPNQADWVGKPLGEQYMPQVTAPQRGIIDIIGIDGQPRVLAFDPIGDDPAGLYVGIGVSPAPYFAQMNSANWQKAWLVAGALGFAFVAIWFGSAALIRRPVDRLLEATMRWRQGDARARASLANPSSELGRLGAAFNEMAVTLEERQHKQQMAEGALARINVTLEHQVKEEVAARQKAQITLQQAQKIEAVGRLTTGIAHDFNNLLTAILGNLELLESRLGKDERAGRLLAAAQRAVDRGAKLTQQLLAFSRQQRLASEPLDINRLVENTKDMLRTTIGPTIRIETVLADALWPALADANQIEMVILNLVINARDAMNVGGAITIATANVTLSAPNRAEEPVAGDYVMLSVTDAGPGIPPDVLEHVFEPFFTTKEVGKGSGLGLPQVLGIAQQLGGGVRIDTVPGEGTSVKIYLPRAKGVTSAERIGAVDETPAAPAHARIATILLVDDDPEVRVATAGLLRMAGHQVIEVGSGGAALDRMDLEGEQIDVVIIDFAMPGMNGVEVARVIRRSWPRVSVLFITGFADQAVLAADATIGEILSKPFRGAELEEKINLALRRMAV
jgi:signal transduction histidine kinase/CheY-like chemotaxis protein